MDSPAKSELNEQTLSQFKAYLLKKRELSAESARIYTQEIVTFRRWLFEEKPQTQLNALTSEDVSKFLTFSPKSTEVGPEAIRRRIRTLKQFFGWLELSERITQNPARNLTVTPQKSARTENALNFEEISALLKAARLRSIESGARDVAILELMLCTGIRLQEVISMSIADVNLETRVVCVRTAARKRYLRFPSSVVKSLRNYLSRRSNLNPSDPLFANTRGVETRLSTRAVQKLIALTASAAKLRRGKVTAQTLRKTFAAQQLGEVDTFQLANLLGVNRDQARRSYHADLHEERKAQREAEKFSEEYRMLNSSGKS